MNFACPSVVQVTMLSITHVSHELCLENIINITIFKWEFVMPRFPILQYDPPVHRERICELLHGYFLKPSHLHYDFLHCLQQTPPNTYFVTIFAWLQLLINLIHLFNAKRATKDIFFIVHALSLLFNSMPNTLPVSEDKLLTCKRLCLQISKA